MAKAKVQAMMEMDDGEGEALMKTSIGKGINLDS